jgi:hypothetical protein
MSYPLGPRTVGYQVASDLAEYLEDAIDHGAFVGPIGAMDLNPALKPLLDAINHVLAGGAVTVTINTPGNPAVHDQLNQELVDALKEANAINKAAGYYVTLAV